MNKKTSQSTSAVKPHEADIRTDMLLKFFNRQVMESAIYGQNGSVR